MKKYLLSLLTTLIIISFSTVNAKTVTLDDLSDLNITHAYVVGDYIFDSSNGFSPTLKDIMEASRTIQDGKPTTIYELMYLKDYNIFSQEELYTKTKTTAKKDFISPSIRYVYMASLGTNNYRQL